MAKSKNYETSKERTALASGVSTCPQRPKPSTTDVYIDMAALLGEEARFTDGQRHIDLRNWLGLGIDEWVCTAGFCLKSMLLSGSRATSSVTGYQRALPHLFNYLIGCTDSHAVPRPHGPSDLSPLHLQHFIGWLQMRAQARALRPNSSRSAYQWVKAVLIEMFSHGFILGDPSRFFPRNVFASHGIEGHHTSLSDAEQERLAKAIKSDFVAIHHGRLTLPHSAVQALRLLLVAHRQGLNPTPLLEMRRDALTPGFMPGTICIRTSKHRNRKIRTSAGRVARAGQKVHPSNNQPIEQDLLFDLSEGAVLQEAIASTRDLVKEAPPALKHRVWLYRSEASCGPLKRGDVTCLNKGSLERFIDGLIKRHDLLGDDGDPLRLNLTRLRKSRFDRALRAADGDIAIAANLLGNTPRVAGAHYPSMNAARKAEAAGFMSNDYTALMRVAQQPEQRHKLRPVQVHPVKVQRSVVSGTSPTPVSGCQDSIGGEYAPGDGHSHCDRYVMCLFCSSFVIVGTIDELWRLFSFQSFAKAELQYLDDILSTERTADDLMEELRDRYRVAIPYIDDFTQRQFARSQVAQARAKAAAGLHPFWQHQMTMTRRARTRGFQQS